MLTLEDALPIYDITHAIRMLIIEKCETTLTWEQLRAPQISQFLVKPIEVQIRSHHFNRATLLAILANALQFRKEAEHIPAMAGGNGTRAMMAELLALRMLKHYSTRELIDALSYDFDPLQSKIEANPEGRPVSRSRGARISAVEIAIRATAKKFLSHPVVVQQLEAIWAGSIVFHSVADNLHRKPADERCQTLNVTLRRSYGTITREPLHTPNQTLERRTVTLYDPRNASLFKLSRLRVPRYRQVFSTLSFAVMLGLYLAVLLRRSSQLSNLEIIFGIYSAGYMLDEVVGFTEQGFGLYIISVWNSFDLGILSLFFIYYALRIYSIFLPPMERPAVSKTAYDVLAMAAIFLFPRAFSALDHYRYFSQLLIAFRMMAQDMVAVMILIVISCSGFFVAFTLAFSDSETYGTHVAYALFQILMGFTPAAWSAWESYDALGRILMTLFLFLAHFLIVTILVSVLSNSFNSIARNANEEHQFLFAVNTISLVKSDALFSYIPPTNVLSWIISPLRFIIPFRQFVKLNRTIIKLTHFPILFTIFVYERLILSRITDDFAEMADGSDNVSPKITPFRPNKHRDSFNGHVRRLREPSMVSHRKEQTLNEVFRRSYREETLRSKMKDSEQNPRKSSHAVANWVQNLDRQGGASPPTEQPRSVLDRLENRRPLFRKAMTTERFRPFKRDLSTATRSVHSDPEDLSSRVRGRLQYKDNGNGLHIDHSLESIPQETEADGDDELATHDEAERLTLDDAAAISKADTHSRWHGRAQEQPSTSSPSAFATPQTRRSSNIENTQEGLEIVTPTRQDRNAASVIGFGKGIRKPHERQGSDNTIVFRPAPEQATSPGSSRPLQPSKLSRTATTNEHGTIEVLPTRLTDAISTASSQTRSEHMSFELNQAAATTDQRNVSPSASNVSFKIDSEALPDDMQLSSSIKVQPTMIEEYDDDVRNDRNMQEGAAEHQNDIGQIMLKRMDELESSLREVVTAIRGMSAAVNVKQTIEDSPQHWSDDDDRVDHVRVRGKNRRLSTTSKDQDPLEQVDQQTINIEGSSLRNDSVSSLGPFESTTTPGSASLGGKDKHKSQREDSSSTVKHLVQHIERRSSNSGQNATRVGSLPSNPSLALSARSRSASGIELSLSHRQRKLTPLSSLVNMVGAGGDDANDSKSMKEEDIHVDRQRGKENKNL